MSRDHHGNADRALHQLHRAAVLLDAMATGLSQIVFQPRLRRILMSLKDDIKTNIDEAMVKVRAQKDVEKALRASVTAQEAQATALLARIAELEAQSGPWTDADMAEIRDGVQALEDALDPEVVVENVLTNTDTPPA